MRMRHESSPGKRMSMYTYHDGGQQDHEDEAIHQQHLDTQTHTHIVQLVRHAIQTHTVSPTHYYTHTHLVRHATQTHTVSSTHYTHTPFGSFKLTTIRFNKHYTHTHTASQTHYSQYMSFWASTISSSEPSTLFYVTPYGSPHTDRGWYISTLWPWNVLAIINLDYRVFWQDIWSHHKCTLTQTEFCFSIIHFGSAIPRWVAATKENENIYLHII